jgi:hypothetical protein
MHGISFFIQLTPLSQSYKLIAMAIAWAWECPPLLATNRILTKPQLIKVHRKCRLILTTPLSWCSETVGYQWRMGVAFGAHPLRGRKLNRFPLLISTGFVQLFLTQTHCKDKTPKFRNKYSQKRNIGVSVPISTFMRLWAIYIFPQLVCLFCWRKYVDRSWDYINRSQTHECLNWGWGRAIPRKVIHKWNFPCSAQIR